jgi:hypothetical protein
MGFVFRINQTTVNQHIKNTLPLGEQFCFDIKVFF